MIHFYRGHKHIIRLLAFGCLLLNVKCGVTVGNSGPPAITNENTEMASLVGLQIDETLGSSADQNTKEASPGELSLLSLGGDLADPTLTSACTEDLATGSATVTSKEQVASQVEFGKARKRRVVTDTKEKESIIVLSQPGGLEAIKCNDRGRPILSWAQLINLKTTEVSKRMRSRSVGLKSDGSILSSSSLVASSERSHVFGKVSLSPGSLIISRTSSFATKIEVKDELDETTLEREIKTLAEEPMVLQRTLSRGSGLSAAKIVSGATESYHTNGKRIILHYKDLQLAIGESCLPSSGSVAGAIYADRDATDAEKTFTVTFTEFGAAMVLEDGQELDLDLETCQL